MKQISSYILEGLRINKNIKINNKYKQFGNGELELLDIEDFIKEVFNVNMTDQKIIDFYDNLKSYGIDTDIEFYHISNDNVNKQLATKLDVLKSKDYSCSNYINVKDKKPYLQISFNDLPHYKLFYIVIVGYVNDKLINEYFLYYRV